MNKDTSYPALIELNKKTIHQGCINVFLTKLYQYTDGLSSELMNDVCYLRKNHYNLRNLNVWATDNPRNKLMLNSTVYPANQLWQTLPSEVKDCPSL